MHRTAPPAAVTWLTAQELGHHRGKIGAFRNRMAMAAMVMDDQVLGPERSNAAHRSRFLSNRQMHGAMHLPPYVKVLCFFFKVADLAHSLQHPNQFFHWQFPQQALAARFNNRINIRRKHGHTILQFMARLSLAVFIPIQVHHIIDLSWRQLNGLAAQHCQVRNLRDFFDFDGHLGCLLWRRANGKDAVILHDDR
jgi:hypothetical protein